LKEIKKMAKLNTEAMPLLSWSFVLNVGHGHKVERNQKIHRRRCPVHAIFFMVFCATNRARI